MPMIADGSGPVIGELWLFEHPLIVVFAVVIGLESRAYSALGGYECTIIRYDARGHCSCHTFPLCHAERLLPGWTLLSRSSGPEIA